VCAVLAEMYWHVSDSFVPTSTVHRVRDLASTFCPLPFAQAAFQAKFVVGVFLADWRPIPSY
jgi:hypothetical protein